VIIRDPLEFMAVTAEQYGTACDDYVGDLHQSEVAAPKR
jgi:hypothetical protein